MGGSCSHRMQYVPLHRDLTGESTGQVRANRNFPSKQFSVMNKSFQPSRNFNTSYLNLLSEKKKKRVGNILNFEVLQRIYKKIRFLVFWKFFFLHQRKHCIFLSYEEEEVWKYRITDIFLWHLKDTNVEDHLNKIYQIYTKNISVLFMYLFSASFI